MLQRRTHPAGCGLTRGSGFELGCDCIQLRVQRTHPRSNTPSITEKESDFAARCSLQLSICSRLFSRQAEMFRNCPATDFARINSSRSSLSGNLSKICYCRTNNRRASTSTVAQSPVPSYPVFHYDPQPNNRSSCGPRRHLCAPASE